MRFLLHGNLTPAAGDALVRHGHVVQRTPSLELPDAAPPAEILKSARAKQLDVVTDDRALCDAALAPGAKFNRSLVYLQLEGGDVEQDDAIDRLFDRYKRLTPGRLYTVTGSRVKIRQLPET